MQIVKCPVCKSKSIEFLDTYISRWNSQEYKLYSCKNCDLQWWEPLKVSPEFYEREGLSAYIIFHKGVRELQKWHKPFFEHFPKNKKGVLLDIGCGDGVFLKEVQTLGFEVWGIDFDKKSVKVAKEKFKLKNVYPMSLEEFVEFANKRGLKFDVITFFEVLEHQDNPVGFMNNVKNLLKPGGYIAGTVPNRDRPLVSLDRKYVNTADFPPHHFLYFNKSSLEFLFNMFNFKDIYFSPVKVDFNHINFFIESTISMGWTKKLINLLKKNVINEENISISSYEKIYGKSWKTELLKHMKILRNILRGVFFLPLNVPLYFLINSKGLQIYFQGKNNSVA